MKFSVETWAPEYGISADAGELVESTGSDVDPEVEIDAASWRPIRPSSDPDAFEAVKFVDGVRRVDARVWIIEGDAPVVGVCASVAAGSVVSTPDAARVDAAEISRGLFAPSTPSATSIDTRHGRYDYHTVNGDGPEAVYLGIHVLMTDLETIVARNDDCDLVVFDGPLRGRKDANGVGYVKTQQMQYLPDELMPVLNKLDDGDRTPLIKIGGTAYDRYSWYQRLPGERAHPLSGIVRMELPATVGDAATAADRADAIASVIPRYASQPHREPRAPQNLYPIAGLEQQLRHRLGHALIMERALRVASR